MTPSVKKYLTEAAKIAAVVAVILGVAGAILPGHVPASVVAAVATASGVVAAFLRWAKDHGITPSALVAKVAHRVR
jgi:hypothetical protein